MVKQYYVLEFNHSVLGHLQRYPVKMDIPSIEHFFPCGICGEILSSRTTVLTHYTKVHKKSVRYFLIAKNVSCSA
jgi:transcription elongation factor Elf1